MATYTVSASSDDGEQESCVVGKGPATGGVMKIANTIHQIGWHGSGASEYWPGGFRFTGITETSISQALFSLVADATYAAGGVVEYIVSCHAVASPGTFVVAGNNDLLVSIRPRTTADTNWVVTSVTGGTRYSVDITTAVQEAMAISGFAGTIAVLVDIRNTTAAGEWQDWRGWDAATSGDEAQLALTASGGSTARPKAAIIVTPQFPQYMEV